MSMRNLSTEQIQRTIDVFNYDRSIPMILVGSAAIKLHMRERMDILSKHPNVDTLVDVEGLQALIRGDIAGKTGPTSGLDTDTMGGHARLQLVPNDMYARNDAVILNAFTGCSDDMYATSFTAARPTAQHDVQTGLLKMPLADILDWKLSINTGLNGLRKIRDVLDVAMVDGDLTHEQIEQFDERVRQQSQRARW